MDLRQRSEKEENGRLDVIRCGGASTRRRQHPSRLLGIIMALRYSRPKQGDGLRDVPIKSYIIFKRHHFPGNFASVHFSSKVRVERQTRKINCFVRSRRSDSSAQIKHLVHQSTNCNNSLAQYIKWTHCRCVDFPLDPVQSNIFSASPGICRGNGR